MKATFVAFLWAAWGAFLGVRSAELLVDRAETLEKRVEREWCEDSSNCFEFVNALFDVRKFTSHDSEFVRKNVRADFKDTYAYRSEEQLNKLQGLPPPLRPREAAATGAADTPRFEMGRHQLRDPRKPWKGYRYRPVFITPEGFTHEQTFDYMRMDPKYFKFLLLLRGVALNLKVLM